MAQEANTQTVRVQKPFRDTAYGGFDRTWIISVTGGFIKPTISERSKNGSHGFDKWILQPGRYAIVSASRPNITANPKPYAVSLQCVEVKNGELMVLASRVMYVMRFSMSDLKELVKAICPPS
jgi:hypothetical protein